MSIPCPSAGLRSYRQDDRKEATGVAGSLRQRGPSSWQLRVHVGRDATTGRKRYLEETFRGPKREAERALASLVLKAERLAGRVGRDYTVAHLLSDWIEHAGRELSPRTVDVVRGYIDGAIVPNIGSIPLTKLTPRDIDRLYTQLSTVGGPRVRYSPATVRRVHGILRRALGQGVRWAYISDNPAANASPPRVPRHELKPPAPAEVALLLKAANESDQNLATFVYLAASTGARRGELLALRWSDVHLKRGVLNIERGLILAGGDVLEQGTKTHQARTVAIDAATVRQLLAHRERREELARQFAVRIAADSFIFSPEPGGTLPLRPDSVSRAFRRLCIQAGVKGVRLHDLRHYVATHLLGAGIDVRTVAGRLGHRDASTTLNVYSHFLPEADRHAAEALGKLLEQASSHGATANPTGHEDQTHQVIGRSRRGSASLGTQLQPETKVAR